MTMRAETDRPVHELIALACEAPREVRPAHHPLDW